MDLVYIAVCTFHVLLKINVTLGLTCSVFLSFHVSSMTAAPLSQIDTWCKENKYIIVGYYQANERTKDSRYRRPDGHKRCAEIQSPNVFCTNLCLLSCRPNQVAEKVAARISENFSDAAIVMVIVNISHC